MVLCYHAISPRWAAGLSVTPEAFERQVTDLVRRGWAAATFTEAIRRPPSTKTMVITFDDAFASVKTYAQPVLSHLGVNATVFAPTDYVSRQAPLASGWARPMGERPRHDKLTPMSWDDLGELAALGWEIGSQQPHPSTADHAWRRRAGQGTARLPRGMRRADRMHGDFDCLSLYGDVDDRVAAHTQQAGYQSRRPRSSGRKRT